uniref:Zinc finger CCHC domain-containing protein n=1 Tax=Sinocyclocheilus grahami TaxID=75366 RepID=A0A672RIU2_SINGR
MDRLNFSRKILQTVLGFQPLHIFALPGRKVFEVVFTTFSAYELCVERFNSKKMVTPCLQKIQLTPERDLRTVTVLIYSERIKKDAEGNYHHLPSLIQLGPIRGYVFYNGQPKECRKCGSLDHIAANYELEIFRHCKSKEHGSKDCQLPKKCNLCGAESHRFCDCPHFSIWNLMKNAPDIFLGNFLVPQVWTL